MNSLHRGPARTRIVLLAAAVLGASLLAGRVLGAPRVESPEAHGDGRFTFKIVAPDAKAVSVSGEFGKGDHPLEKGKQGTEQEGVWSVTLGPLPPGLWGYSFKVDGFKTSDPANADVKPSRFPTTSLLVVPGNPPRPFEDQKNPRGTLHLHDYNSAPLGGMPRRLRVYTPPGYERGRATYPVLYLLHGFSDNQAVWTEYGHAHVIADNMIAAKQAVPMIIVMTDGHTTPLTGDSMSQNLENFNKDVLGAVIPLVESIYRVKKGAQDRAIIGLSMGGGHSLTLGLRNPDKFAWVGAMSAGVRPMSVFDDVLPRAGDLNRRLHLLWIWIGKDDFLIDQNRELTTLLQKHGINHEYHETEGAHSWPVWRDYLIEFLPRIFKTRGAASKSR